MRYKCMNNPDADGKKPYQSDIYSP